jgi:RNA polymerase sigma-70 factor (ECF subfamily)
MRAAIYAALPPLVTTSATASMPQGVESKLDVAQIYAQHATFLWKSLFRMGIPEADLPDVLQEVLLVVHRRLDSFDGRSRLSTWLFGICLRVAATARRTRRRRREEPMDPNLQSRALANPETPESLALVQDARRRLGQALDSLDPEKRAVFVMFELEGVGCSEIAELLGIPKGTVFSRLAYARQVFLQALQRIERRDDRTGYATGGER